MEANLRTDERGQIKELNPITSDMVVSSDGMNTYFRFSEDQRVIQNLIEKIKLKSPYGAFIDIKIHKGAIFYRGSCQVAGTHLFFSSKAMSTSPLETMKVLYTEITQKISSWKSKRFFK